MARKPIYLLLALLLTGQAYSQVIEWQKSIGSGVVDFPEFLSFTSDNHILVSNNSFSNTNVNSSPLPRGDLDFWLLKVNNEDGSVLWEEYFGGNAFDLLVAAYETPDSGYILAGYSDSSGSRDKLENNRGGDDYWIIKLDVNRNIEWQRTIGGPDNDRLTTMIQTADGGYLLGGDSISSSGGEKSGFSRGMSDMWIVKLDASGNIEWEETYGGSLNDFVDTILIAPDGGYVLAGSSSSNAGFEKGDNAKGIGEDYWVLHIDGNGTIIWQRTIGGSSTDVLRHAINTNDGAYLLSGTSNSGISADKDEPTQDTDVWLVKLELNGNIIWKRNIGTSGTEWLMGSANASDGGFFLGVMSNANANGPKTENARGGRDYWGVKIDALGNIEWEKTLGGSENDNPQYVLQTPDRGYLMAGWSDSGISGDKNEPSIGPSRDVWLVKLRACEEDAFAITSNSPICSGTTLNLSAEGGVSYAWTGPNGFVSNEREPEISQSEQNQSGTYTVTITVDAFCTELLTTEVVVEAAPPLNELGEILVCDPEEDGFFEWDTSNIENLLLSGVQDVTIEFYDRNNSLLPYPLPNPYSNAVQGPELIRVVVYNNNGLSCGAETFFTLVPQRIESGDCISKDLDVPNFFTPNNDGYNDVWQVSAEAEDQIDFIQIYDRYGKLIQSLNTGNLFWNGLYKGKPMPSGDYWYLASYKTGAKNTGHFTLKR